MMNNEIVVIPGMEGKYGITKRGEVYSFNYRDSGNTQKLTPYANRHGYIYLRLWKVGREKNYLVHRLVALTFIPNPENKPEVNHIDSNRANNNVNNLEWVTKSENCKHAYRFGSQTIPGNARIVGRV